MLRTETLSKDENCATVNESHAREPLSLSGVPDSPPKIKGKKRTEY